MHLLISKSDMSKTTMCVSKKKKKNAKSSITGKIKAQCNIIFSFFFCLRLHYKLDNKPSPLKWWKQTVLVIRNSKTS